MPARTKAAPLAPGSLPLLGHTLHLWRDHLTWLEALRPLGDVVLVHLGRRPVYVLTSAEMVHRVLVTRPEDYGRGLFNDKLIDILGESIGTAEGEAHKQRRRLMAPAFRRARLRTYAMVVYEETSAMIDSWRSGQRIAVVQVMHDLTTSITLKILCHQDLDEHTGELERWFPIFFDGAFRRLLSPSPLLQKLPTRRNRRYNHAIASICQVVDWILAKHEADPRDRGDLLSILAAAADDHTGVPLKLRDELLTLVFAGTESTGSTLSWLFHEIGRHPHHEQRLVDEVTIAIGDRAVTFDDLPRLPFTQRVVNETLRMHTPPWLQMRRTLTAVELGDVAIPPGADLLFSPHIVHHDPRLYSDPHRFAPDRWENSPPSNAFFPFGAGANKCLGDHLATAEIAIAAATILRRWRLVQARDARPVHPVPRATVRPGNLMMIAEPRT